MKSGLPVVSTYPVTIYNLSDYRESEILGQLHTNIHD